MIAFEYQILQYIHEYPMCQWTEVVKAFDPESQCRLTDHVLHSLVAQDLLRTDAQPPLCQTHFAAHTIHFLLQHKEQMERENAALAREAEIRAENRAHEAELLARAEAREDKFHAEAKEQEQLNRRANLAAGFGALVAFLLSALGPIIQSLSESIAFLIERFLIG